MSLFDQQLELEVSLSILHGDYPKGFLTPPVLGTRERHLESILQSTLRQIILIHNFPRTLIQITLQITSTPENKTVSSKLAQAGSICT